MSMATYWQRGEALDYLNETTAAIAAGAVIKLGDSYIGVAAQDIAPSTTGVVHVSGVFRIPKKDGDDIAAFAKVYFDGEQITSTSTGNNPAGYAVTASSATNSTVLVKLLG